MIGESRKDRMATPITPDSYKEMILFLATAGVVVPLFHRLRISPVLGFLGAGALLGPFGLGRLTDTVPWLSWFTIANREEMAHLAEFGVVFLLFMIGIELSWERLRTLRRLVFGFGSLQVAGSAAVLALLTYAVHGGMTSSILVGLALGLSSTAIVVPILVTQRRLNSPTGRTTFSVLLFQDLAVAPILFTIGVLGSGESGNIALSFLIALAQAALALIVLVGVGRLVLRPLFHMVAATRSPELFMAASFLVVLVTSLIAAVSGLSMAIGAFIAGLLLAETEYRRAIEAMIDPFKGLLLGVFFVSVGTGLDVTRLAANPLLIVAGTLLLIGLKAAVIFWVAAVFRLARQTALKTALLLGPGGEFAFVILGAAMAAGLVPDVLGQESLVITTLSMFAIPALARIGLRLGERIGPAAAGGPAPEPPPIDDGGRVVIAGFGRVGQLVGEMLARHKVPFIAVDSDPGLVASQRKAGKPVYYGDSTSAEFLRVCGLENARALVVTLNSSKATEAAVSAARQARPDLTIVARARDARHAASLYRLGVYDAVPENFEASLQLSEAVLVDIGVPMGLVIASIHERRDEFRRVLRQSGDDARETAEEEGRGEFRGRRTAGKRAG
jgi:CPA2 family monovalent cation:H+ antiporter-2